MMSLLGRTRSFRKEFSRKTVALTAAGALTLSAAMPAFSQGYDGGEVAYNATPVSLMGHNLQRDADGVLWFNKVSERSESVYSVSQDLSQAMDKPMVIAVSASSQNRDALVDVSKRLESVLEGRAGVHDVLIVAKDDLPRGGGIVFYVGGVAITTARNVTGLCQNDAEISDIVPLAVSEYKGLPRVVASNAFQSIGEGIAP